MPLMYACGECGRRFAQHGTCPTDAIALAYTDDPLIGTDVARYRLTRLIGQGGMGRVYLAVHPEIGSRVAVKLLADDAARSPELLERFFGEAKAVNVIRHESIVSILDLGRQPDGRPYIVMEYVDGKTLRDLARGGPVPLGGLAHVMTEVLLALHAAHGKGIVHRDLKPDNVMVTATGHAKVLDFGIAKLARTTAPRTLTGVALGTPDYMAPEQIAGGEIDPRTDVYAAGVVLYEVATGQRPFPGDTDYVVMEAHLHQPAPDARTVRADLPAPLAEVIARALAKSPAERFASAKDMARAVRDSVAMLGPEQQRPVISGAWLPGAAPEIPRTIVDQAAASLPTRRARPLAPAPRRRGRIAVVALLVAIAGGVAWIAHARRDPAAPPIEGPAAASARPTVGSPAASPAASGLPPTIVRVAAHYEPMVFDPMAFLPAAQRIARELVPDAELLMMAASPVERTGLVDLAVPSSFTVYQFRSKAGRRVAGNGDPSPCIVSVHALAREVTADLEGSALCDIPLPAPPHCALPEVIAKLAITAPLAWRVMVSFGPQWTGVAVDLATREARSFGPTPDDCR